VKNNLRFSIDYGHLIFLIIISGWVIWYWINARSVSTSPENLLIIQPVSIGILILTVCILPQVFRSVDIPAEFTLGETYPITVHYTVPTSCYYFSSLYYDKDLNIRTIAIENAIAQRNNCQDLSAADGANTHTFNFYVTSNGSYIFKFYQGKDDQGNNIFLEYEVPVTN
jgi:hypothetical protein